MYKTKSFIFLALLLIVMGCSKNDPNDPKTWISKLDNPKTRDEAISKVGELKIAGAADKLIDILKEDDKSFAPKALRSIIQIDNEEKIIEAVKIGVNSKNKSVSTLSINSIKGLKNPNPKLIQLIIDSIDATEMFTKEAAILATGDMKIKDAVPALIKVAENMTDGQHIILNKQAVVALGQLGDPKAIPTLIKALFIIKDSKGNKGGTFAVARDALVAFGKPALDAIRETIDGKNEDFKNFQKSNPKLKQSDIDFNFMVMLGEMGTEEEWDILQKFLSHSDSEVRVRAQAAIGSINITKAVPVLIKRYNQLKGMIVKEKDENELPKLVNEATNINRMLASLRTPEALKHVMKEALSGDLKIDGETFPDLRIDAAQSLSNFAGYDYYKDYQQLWAKEKDVDLKATFEVTLKVMELTNECKKDVACYIKALDRNKKDETFVRQKATYSLVDFNTPEAKKAIFEKSMVDKDPGVIAASVYVMERIGTKDDIKELDKVIEISEKKTHLKKSRSLFKKLRSKLEAK
ncbi:HEAT repeat domain-containing protein [bacterium]|nr:HEAT repeat domain-containing protein [bacterium]